MDMVSTAVLVVSQQQNFLVTGAQQPTQAVLANAAQPTPQGAVQAAPISAVPGVSVVSTNICLAA